VTSLGVNSQTGGKNPVRGTLPGSRQGGQAIRPKPLLSCASARAGILPAPPFLRSSLPSEDTAGSGTGRLIHSRTVHQGRVVEVAVDRVELPNGHQVDLDMVRHPGAAAVVPFITETHILLVRQYRWAAGGFIYEIPAGRLDHKGEEPLACARRELLEEVGQHATSFKPLGSIVTAPGFTDEVIHLFLATGLQTGQQNLEQDEVLDIVRLPFDQALDWALAGRIRDAKTLCGLLRADLFHRRGDAA